MISIEDACELVTDGTHYTPPDVGEGVPFLTVKDMSAQGLDFTSCSYITPDEYIKADFGNSAPKVGDVLFSKDGTVGKVHVVSENREFAVLSSIAILRPKAAVLDSKYFGYIFRSPVTLDQAARRKTGSALRRIILKDLKQVQIPFPSLEEQRRIAAILDKADAVRRKRKEAIALTEELLRSAFLEMFGDPITNPKGWEIVTFGELAPEKGQIVDGPFGSSLKPECYVSSGVRVVRNFNIHDDFFDQSSFVYVTKEKFAEICRSNVHPGDLLLSTKGTIGNVCIMPALQGESVLSASGTVRIRLPKNSRLLPEVIVHQMIQQSYKQYLKRLEAGTNQKYLNLSGIRKMKLIVPPIGLQYKFTSIWEKTLKLKFDQEIVFSESNDFFNSLLQRAFRGEL